MNLNIILFIWVRISKTLIKMQCQYTNLKKNQIKNYNKNKILWVQLSIYKTIQIF